MIKLKIREREKGEGEESKLGDSIFYK